MCILNTLCTQAAFYIRALTLSPTPSMSPSPSPSSFVAYSLQDGSSWRVLTDDEIASKNLTVDKRLLGCKKRKVSADGLPNATAIGGGVVTHVANSGMSDHTPMNPTHSDHSLVDSSHSDQNQAEQSQEHVSAPLQLRTVLLFCVFVLCSCAHMYVCACTDRHLCACMVHLCACMVHICACIFSYCLLMYRYVLLTYDAACFVLPVSYFLFAVLPFLLLPVLTGAHQLLCLLCSALCVYRYSEAVATPPISTTPTTQPLPGMTVMFSQNPSLHTPLLSPSPPLMLPNPSPMATPSLSTIKHHQMARILCLLPCQRLYPQQ